MTNNKSTGKNPIGQDKALAAIPYSNRQHWTTPAVIFGGLEFTIPVLMVGATLIGSFGLSEIFWILLIGLVIIQWIGNSLQGYIGAKTGRSSSVIAKTSFGSNQARFIVGVTIFVISMGWWAVQTAVAGNAISAMLGINYNEQWFAWAAITVIAGLLFAIPSILGFKSMKWTDYVAVPAGLLLVIGGIYYALSDIGWETIWDWSPEPTMTFATGISLVIGANVAQWVIAADYTRYAKPTVKDNILIPLGIIAIGFPLFYTGAIMSVGVGEADIVEVMVGLGFPIWGFLILWLATWTSQLVNNYSMGLALSNICNINSDKGRALLTLVGTLIAIAITLTGFLALFEDFLLITAIIYPAIAGVIMSDFFLVKNKSWKNNQGWNWMATIAIAIGSLIGIFTEYIYPIGIPAVQSLIGTAFAYYVLMNMKARVAPDQFTPEHLKQNEDEPSSI